MLNGSLSILARDERLPHLTVDCAAELCKSLANAVPGRCLDAPAHEYRLDNLRYHPGKKAVFSLLSPQRERPVSIRMFPPGIARGRYKKARAADQRNAYLLEDMDAVAWVFPSERKLRLDLMADRQALAWVIQKARGIRLGAVELVHYVPEHTYTARVVGTNANGEPVTEFVKIYYNEAGQRTANICRELASQLSGVVVVPNDVCYLPKYRLLVQAALNHDSKVRVTDSQAAVALAIFHGLQSQIAPYRRDTFETGTTDTLRLVNTVYPEHGAILARLVGELAEARRASKCGPLVLTHGDAHLGNLLPLEGGKIGVIDLDAVAWGRAEEDLASYFGFKLWLEIREGRDPLLALLRYETLIDLYNRIAQQPIDTSRAYLSLASTMVTRADSTRHYPGASFGRPKIWTDSFLWPRRASAPASVAMAESASALTTFLPHLSAQKQRIVFAYGFSLANVLIGLVLPWPLKYLIDGVLVGTEPVPLLPSWPTEAQVAVLAGSMALLAWTAALTLSAEKVLHARVREEFGLSLRDRLVQQIYRLSPFARQGEHSGELTMRLVSDSQLVSRLFCKTAPRAIKDLGLAVATLSVIFWIDPQIGLVALSLALLLGVVIVRYGPALNAAAKEKRHREGRVAALTQESIAGIQHIQAMALEDQARERYLDESAISLRAGVDEVRVAVAMERAAQVSSGCAMALIAGVGGLLVLRGQLTLGVLTVCIAYVTQLLKTD